MFFHAGTLMNAKTPNQVIGVIAHESGHITGGHLARLRTQISRAKSAALMLQILGLAAMAGGALAGAPGLGQVGMGAAFGGTDAAMRSVLAYQQTEESSADQAAITFLNATKQSGRGMLETFEFMDAKLKGMQGINPYLQSHPLPAQRITQLQDARRPQVPITTVTDPPELQLRHDLVKAKLYGFLDKPETVFNRYPQTDQSLAGGLCAGDRHLPSVRGAGGHAAARCADRRPAQHGPISTRSRDSSCSRAAMSAAPIPPLREAVQARSRGAAHPHHARRRRCSAPTSQQHVDEAITNLRTALAREDTSATGYRQLAAAYARKAEAAKAGQAQAAISWPRPSLHRPRPISMKVS